MWGCVSPVEFGRRNTPLLLFVLGRTTYAQVFGDDNLRINHTVIFESIISFLSFAGMR